MSSKDNDSDDIYDCVVVGLGGHGSSTVANLGNISFQLSNLIYIYIY